MQIGFIANWRGKVDPKNILLFSDCLIDGFTTEFAIRNNIYVRPTRRSTGYRIDTHAGAHYVIVSADIFEDGRTTLHESQATGVGIIGATAEKATYQTCLEKYGIK